MIPATEFQRSMALASISRPGAPVFVEQFVLECPASVDSGRLRSAWADVLDRHPGLSAQYDFVGSDLVLRKLVDPDVDRSFTSVTVASTSEAEQWCDAEYRSFTPGSDEPLWRVLVVERGDGGGPWCCITLHHLIIDDRSLRTVRADFVDAIAAPTRSVTPALRFDEFLTWRASADRRSGPMVADARNEWAALCAGLEGPTVLPRLDTEQPDGHDNIRFGVTLDDDLIGRIRGLADDADATVHTVVLAAWSLVLGRLCRTEVVCFGQTRHGVPDEFPDAATTVGPTMRTLPFVQPVDESVDALTFVRDVAERHRRMYRLAPLDVADLVEIAGLTGAGDIMTTIVNHVRTGRADDGRWPIIRQRKSAALQPTLAIVADGSLQIEVVTHPRHGGFGRISAEALGHALRGLVERPPALDQVSLVDPTATPAVVLAGPSRTFDERTLQGLVEASLQAHRDRSALDGPERLTYAELDRRSMAIAAAAGLTERSDRACVAVIAEPGLHMVGGVVAAIRSGHYFVCVDPTRPVDEVLRLLAVVEPDLVLTGPGVDVTADDPRWPSWPLDESIESSLLDTTAGAAPRDLPAPDDLAYLVATSGSTGVPKVIEIEQASAANAINALVETYGMTPNDRRLRSVSRPGSDVFISELLVPLCSGATLVEAIGRRAPTPAEFFELVDEAAITVAGAASSALAELVAWRLDDPAPPPTTLRLMTIGTEAVDPMVVDGWHRSFGDSTVLLNVYGPAEATLVATTSPLSELPTPLVGPTPVGRPLANVHVLLLDPAGHPVPIGAVGEIGLAGAGVMRGHRGLATTSIIEASAGRPRHLRTGDLGRIGVDGQLVFLGRIDRQVKIRGHRVELDAVEIRLRSAAAGANVAAVAVERRGRRMVVGLVESTGGTDDETAAASIRHRMMASGDTAEVPSVVSILDRLPRLANGKLDRRAIERRVDELLDRGEGQRIEIPTSFGVDAVVALWNDLFERDDCSPNSDFFDLGGDSLLAVRLAAEIDRRFGVRIGLDVVYTQRTLGAIVAATCAPAIVDEEPSSREAGATHIVPVYFMHTGSGLTRGWDHVTRRLGDGFDCRHVVGRNVRGLPMAASVSEACVEYAELLSVDHRARSHESDGPPIVIVGFSTTGVYAYETARLACRAGVPIRCVVLLESTPTGLRRWVRLAARAVLVGRSPRRLVHVVRRAARRVRRAVTGDGRVADLGPGYLYIDLAIDHRLGRAEFDIVVVESRDPALGMDLSLAWSVVARRRVIRRVVDVDRHHALLDGCGAPTVAAIVREVTAT
jgi:amino acid adenylation domain-containing protein